MRERERERERERAFIDKSKVKKRNKTKKQQKKRGKTNSKRGKFCLTVLYIVLYATTAKRTSVIDLKGNYEYDFGHPSPWEKSNLNV